MAVSTGFHRNPLAGDTRLRPGVMPATHPSAAAEAVRSVMVQGAHLPYAALEAWVDGALAPAEQARHAPHLRWCRRCTAELADLKHHAAALRQPLPSASADGRQAGKLWRLLGHGLPWLSGGAVAAVLVAGVALDAPEPGGGRGDAGAARIKAVPVMAAMPIEAVNAGALDELKTVSEAAVRARAADDFALLATLLRAAAEAGNPTAAEALGLLYLRGDGVKADTEAAVRLWRAAAAQGSARAQRNLDVIGRG